MGVLDFQKAERKWERRAREGESTRGTKSKSQKSPPFLPPPKKIVVIAHLQSQASVHNISLHVHPLVTPNKYLTHLEYRYIEQQYPPCVDNCIILWSYLQLPTFVTLSLDPGT